MVTPAKILHGPVGDDSFDLASPEYTQFRGGVSGPALCFDGEVYKGKPGRPLAQGTN